MTVSWIQLYKQHGVSLTQMALLGELLVIVLMKGVNGELSSNCLEAMVLVGIKRGWGKSSGY